MRALASLRARAAASAAVAVNWASRRAGLGSGTVAGGRAGLVVDPHLVEKLCVGRPVALVSGTNGKTTTTALLAGALGAGLGGGVVTNATGSNMTAGHAAALAAGGRTGPVVLEVDEAYLPAEVASLEPTCAVLLNLSRDQLDRTSEVRMLANRWRVAFAGGAPVDLVANADDPLVVWAAGQAERVHWIGAGLGWRNDAVGCPSCGEQVTFADAFGAGGWSCVCGFARPALEAWLEEAADGGSLACFADGRRLVVDLELPGRFNRANALMAAVAASSMGVGADEALGAMAQVPSVAGRFTVGEIAGSPTRLMLAKNPAGWSELLDLVGGGTAPVVVAINARTADGKDPSWLWDVEFEALAGRTVVATGERARDLAVRLRYAGVDHATVDDPRAAVAFAALEDGRTAAPVEFIGNYTAFHDLLDHAR